MDNSTAGSANFTFGIGNTALFGYINLDTSIRLVIFHIVSVNTLFLLRLANMDKLGVFFNNVTNELVHDEFVCLVVCRYGHAFLMWHTPTYLLVAKSLDVNLCYLTEVELCRLHCRFGHLLVCCLEAVLY